MSNGDAHYKADRDETRMVIGIWMNMIRVALISSRFYPGFKKYIALALVLIFRCV